MLRAWLQAALNQLHAAHKKELAGVSAEVGRLRRVIQDALEGELVTHEQQYKARQLLYFESLKRMGDPRLVGPGNVDSSLTWRAKAEKPVLATPRLAGAGSGVIRGRAMRASS